MRARAPPAAAGPSAPARGTAAPPAAAGPLAPPRATAARAPAAFVPAAPAAFLPAADVETRASLEKLEEKLLAELATAARFAAVEAPAPAAAAPERARGKPQQQSRTPSKQGVRRAPSEAARPPSVVARAWPPRHSATAGQTARNGAAPPAAAQLAPQVPLAEPQPPPPPRSAPSTSSVKLAAIVPASARGKLVEWLKGQRDALQAERAAVAWLLQSLQRGARDTRSGMEQARLVFPPPPACYASHPLVISPRDGAGAAPALRGAGGAGGAGGEGHALGGARGGGGAGGAAGAGERRGSSSRGSSIGGSGGGGSSSAQLRLYVYAYACVATYVCMRGHVPRMNQSE